MANRGWFKSLGRKVPFADVLIDLTDEINRRIGVSNWTREEQIAYHLMGPTGNRLDLIDLLTAKEVENNGNQRIKQVQGRTGKYQGHYHKLYGVSDAGNAVSNVARNGYKRRAYTGKRNQKRYYKADWKD